MVPLLLNILTSTPASVTRRNSCMPGNQRTYYPRGGVRDQASITKAIQLGETKKYALQSDKLQRHGCGRGQRTQLERKWKNASARILLCNVQCRISISELRPPAASIEHEASRNNHEASLKHEALSSKRRVSSIEHQAPSVKNQASSNKHQAASHKHRGSCINHSSRINYQAASINL